MSKKNKIQQELKDVRKVNKSSFYFGFSAFDTNNIILNIIRIYTFFSNYTSYLILFLLIMFSIIY